MESKSRPRSTKVKLLLCGRTATANYYEKEIWYNSQYSKKKNNNETRKEKIEEEKIDIKKRSAYRSRNNVYNLISTNAWFWKKDAHSVFWPAFLTLTFKENITDIKEGNYLHSKFIKKLNYFVYHTKKSQLKYVSVIEFQKRGAIHYHILFFNLPHVDKKQLAEIWEHGFIVIKGADKDQNIAGYLTKYMTKGIKDTRLDGKKRYFCSRKLLKPIEINIEDQALALLSKIPEKYVRKQSTYESDYHGIISVVEYDFGQGKSIQDILKLS